MFNEPHDLQHEFPEYKHRIEELILSNPAFEQLVDEYTKLDREVRRITLEIEHTSDTHLENLKKNRLQLKDELYKILKDS
jgi:hypothetical protein